MHKPKLAEYRTTNWAAGDASVAGVGSFVFIGTVGNNVCVSGIAVDDEKVPVLP